MRCVVLLPWDLQLTVFAELYALGVPIVLPTAEYIASYGLRTLTTDGEGFWAVHPRFAGRLPGPWGRSFAAEPWLRDLENGSHTAAVLAEAQLLYWLRASDFEAFPHTLRFQSVPQLLSLGAGTPVADLQAIHVRMREAWAASRLEAAAVYEDVVHRLALTLDREIPSRA